MTLSMLCRAARPTVLSQTPAAAAAAVTLCIRQAHSLSAIHAGIRRSSKNESSMTYAERKAAREALPKPTYKIRKGKKDITEYPAKADPQTRRARFYDPESNFGHDDMEGFYHEDGGSNRPWARMSNASKCHA